MKVSYEDHGPVSVLTMSGSLTADQVDAFGRAVEDRFSAGIRHVVLDMTHVGLVDSAGLEKMLWLSSQLDRRGGRLRLVGLDDTVSRILAVTRLERKFDVHESIESAARSLR